MGPEGVRELSDRRHPPSVLVCDSEPQSVRALKAVLRQAGFEVDATYTAEEALTRAALRVPDAAIIEMTLPDGTGTQICRALRRWSAVPVILLSRVSDEIPLLEAF